MVKNLWFTPERSYIFKKWLLPLKLKPWFKATMSTETFGKLKLVINFNAKAQLVILMTFYMLVMRPTSLLAMIMVLNALKIHCMGSDKLLPLPFLKFFNKDSLSSRDCRFLRLHWLQLYLFCALCKLCSVGFSKSRQTRYFLYHNCMFYCVMQWL